VTDASVVSPSGAHEGPAVAIFASRDLDRAQALYASLGFVADRVQSDYLLLWRGEAMLHVALVADFDPLASACAAFVVASDVDAVFADFAATGLEVFERPGSPGDASLQVELRGRRDAGASLARLSTVEDKPWGIREFALFDADNNLLRYGTFLAGR